MARDPARIRPLLDGLEALWRHYPDMRLGQLVHWLCPKGEDYFYVEDGEWKTRLEYQLSVAATSTEQRESPE